MDEKKISSPCEQCIVIIMCKERFNRKSYISVSEFAWNEECPILHSFIVNANQNQINKLRQLYGLRVLV